MSVLRSAIEWCDSTWNPVRGCSRVSPGCVNCYAERAAIRQVHKAYAGFVRSTSAGPRWTGRVELVTNALDFPLRLKKPQRIFVNSMSDLFHEALPDMAIEAVFAVMALAPRHTFQVLTKRPERMRRWFASGVPGLETRAEDVMRAAEHSGGVVFDGRGDARHLYPPGAGDVGNRRPWPGWPLPNVWLGASVENRATLPRIDELRETPAAVRFISFEPLLEDLGQVDLRGIHHAILGGESGPGARSCSLTWIRSLLGQCMAAGLAPFVKQLGRTPTCEPDERHGTQPRLDGARKAWTLEGGRPVLLLKDRKGGDMAEWPQDLRIREFPA